MEKLKWVKWNSGGGCMIHSTNLPDGRSLQMSDECLVLTSVTHEKYWNMDDHEDQEPTHLFVTFLSNFDDITADIAISMVVHGLKDYIPQVVEYYDQEFNEDEVIEAEDVKQIVSSNFSKACVLPDGHVFQVHETDRICDVFEVFENHGFAEYFAPFVNIFVEERRNVQKAN